MFCVIFSSATVAGDKPEKSSTVKRPRIGLVLGGGGARGIAHVGVLRVLEEQNIPVDFIVGTSIGSIVGGLYAMGMSPDEITQEIEAIDWNDLFDDLQNRADRSFRRKRDDEQYAFKAKIGVNEGRINIPLAYVRGQKLHVLLSRLTLPVAGIKNFDKLPIPYRAVAADIETGKQVVLGKGSLADAIRASMAVPAVFDPMEIDGHLLIDGGIANNVPVSVARDLGADLIIAVDVGSGLYSREKIKTGLDVTGQLANFLFTLNTEKQLSTLSKQDTLIRPELGDLGGSDFDREKEIIELGEEAARGMIGQLQRYALTDGEYQQYLSQRKAASKSQPIIEFIRVDNKSGVSDEVVKARISAKTGEPLDIPQLENDIAHLYGLEIFEYVRYEIIQENEKTGLLLKVKETGWGPGYLQFGLSTSNVLKTDTSYRLGILYTQTQINELNGEWRIAVQLGDEPEFYTEIHQPLDTLSRYFVSAGAGYEHDDVNVYDSSGNQLGRYLLRKYKIDFGAGREFGTWGEGRIGLRREGGKGEVTIGTPAPDVDIDLAEIYLRLSDDKLDNLYFPRQGHFGAYEYRVSREGYGASADYDQWIFNFTHAASWQKDTLIGAISFGRTVNDNAPIESQFELGGFLRLSGLKENQLAGQHTGLLTMIYMRRLADVEFLQLINSYAGISLEAGNVWQNASDISFDNTITAGSLFLGFDTPIGPLYVAYGRTDTDQDSVYIYLGPRFNY